MRRHTIKWWRRPRRIKLRKVKTVSIHGKVALVTGSGQGIGRAIALRLANDGGDIAVVDLNEEKIKAVADEVRAVGRKATTFKADVSQRDDVYAAIAHAEKELGGFDTSSTTQFKRA